MCFGTCVVNLVPIGEDLASSAEQCDAAVGVQEHVGGGPGIDDAHDTLT